MPQDVNTNYQTESEKRGGSRPDVKFELRRPLYMSESIHMSEDLHMGTKIEDESGRVVSVSTIDRVLEQYNSPGVLFANQVNIALENTDGEFNPNNISSTYVADGLLKRNARVYLFFKRAVGGDTDEEVLFTGDVYKVSHNQGRTATLTIRDALQDMVDAKFSAVGSTSGNVADVLKTILETSNTLSSTGFSVDDDEYTETYRRTAGSYVEISWTASDTVGDILQNVNTACGTTLFTNTTNDVVMHFLAPDWGLYYRLKDAVFTEELKYVGTETDKTNLNIISSQGDIDIFRIINRVSMAYTSAIDSSSTLTEVNDTASQAIYGIRTLEINTSAKLYPHLADIWPNMLLERFGDPVRQYNLSTSLKNGVRALIADRVRYTDISGSENNNLHFLINVGQDLTNMTTRIRCEDFDDADDEKWAFVGSEDIESGGNRQSSEIDFLHNKSFEVADSDPTLDKWTVVQSTGTFTFVRSSADENTGEYSGLLTVTAGTGTATQDISLNPLENSTSYALQFMVKGSVSSGQVDVRILNDSGTALETLTLTGSISDFAKKGLYFTTDADPPFDVQIRCGGSTTAALYFDNMQIDKPLIPNASFEEGLLGSTPTNWSIAGGGSFDKSNAVTAEEGSFTGLIDGAGGVVAATSASFVHELVAGSHELNFSYRGTVGDVIQVIVRDQAAASLGYVTIPIGTYSSWTDGAVTFTVAAADHPIDVQLTATTHASNALHFDDLNIDGNSYFPFQINWQNFCYYGHEADDTNPGTDLDGNANTVLDEDILNGLEKLNKVW